MNTEKKAAIKRISLITISDTVCVTAPNVTPNHVLYRTKERGRVLFARTEQLGYLQKQCKPSVEVEKDAEKVIHG